MTHNYKFRYGDYTLSNGDTVTLDAYRVVCIVGTTVFMEYGISFELKDDEALRLGLILRLSGS